MKIEMLIKSLTYNPKCDIFVWPRAMTACRPFKEGAASLNRPPPATLNAADDTAYCEPVGHTTMQTYLITFHYSLVVFV